jgi:hypothetical protein
MEFWGTQNIIFELYETHGINGNLMKVKGFKKLTTNAKYF